ncbi:MAG: cell division protein ZapA [Chitinivibrionales bacterium]|nr:cell division protein ZapA [Chitinivibrionales bacterium]
MGLSSDSVHVFIFGNEYSVRSDVDAELTRRVADYVSKKMVETQSGTASRDKLKIAVLSSMNISGELFEYKKIYDNQREQLDSVEQRAQSLCSRIDSVLGS